MGNFLKSALFQLGALLVTNWLPVAASATEPWPSVYLVDPTGAYRVELAPWGSAVTVYDRTDKKLHALSIEELDPGYSHSSERSTAGLLWYVNALPVFHESKAILFIRFPTGRTIGLDLLSGKPIVPLGEELRAMAGYLV